MVERLDIGVSMEASARLKSAAMTSIYAWSEKDGIAQFKPHLAGE